MGDTVQIKKRLRLGILFKFSSGWMGGVIYILNIIKTLNQLDDGRKPYIILFYTSTLEKYLKEINYPYLETVKWSFPALIPGYFKSWLLRKNLFIDGIINRYSLDALFPLHDFPVRVKSDVKLIAWWADLQHNYYPEYFSTIQIWARNVRIRLILKYADRLVVSSEAVADDFAKFYHNGVGKKISIFHFVSIIDNLYQDNIKEIKERFGLPGNYFLVSNQFHRHKNHKVVLLALAKLKERGQHLFIAFTGKFPAESHSPYLSELHRIIDENDLSDQVAMLGMISRNEQLLLMKYSQAVIQPSLFEGWSTVIEDAISLQVPVISSHLKVNTEQLGRGNIYFDPHSPDELASILADYPQRNLNDCFYEDYSARTKRAASQFLEILTTSIKNKVIENPGRKQ
ncbi:MAG: glycosyltransferase family 4 protein [Bacteroidales bacterium]|nr:glycosyltransferase family 4 protein [Bacteroidales bacterium]